MSDQVKAVIAEFDENIPRDLGDWANLARKLRDALEAAQPQGEYHEGLEEGIKIGRAEAAQQAPSTSVQEVLELLDAFHGDNRMGYDAYANLHDAVALLDVQQAPAVDRGQLLAVVERVDGNGEYPSTSAEFIWGALVDGIIASGVLQDASVLAREVEARGLEKAADKVEAHWAPDTAEGEEIVEGTAALLRESAQQVREGKE